MIKGGGAENSADGLIGRLSSKVLILLFSFSAGLKGLQRSNDFLLWILAGGMGSKSWEGRDTAGRDSDLLCHGLVRKVRVLFWWCMGAGGTRAVSWEGRGTGVTGFYLLGGHCRGRTTASVCCSVFRVCCSDLADGDTGGRGLQALALENWL